MWQRLTFSSDFRYINRDLLMGQNNLSHLPRGERYRLNLVKIIYWTCLQMESDILAEMSTLFPTSITKFQADILYPDGVSEHMPDLNTATQPRPMTNSEPSFFIYSGLIALRVLLNGAHNQLYGACK